MASIRERVSKTGESTWAVLYRHGTKQASLTFPSEKKASDFKALVDVLGPDKAIKALDDGEADNRLTVSELAAKFLDWKAGDVTQRTMTDYRRDVANWVVPWFGHMAAEQVDETDVQNWVEHMRTKLAPKSVADRHMLLHSMYQFGKAKTRRLVTHNPCLETELPKAGKKRAKGTTVPQWRAILSAAHDRNPDAEDLIRFLGTVGWRFSEGIALPVGAIDDRGSAVWVDMTQVFRIIDNRQILVHDAAKSYAGFRNVPVPSDETAQMLLRRCVGKNPEDLVFTNSRGNQWNQNTFLRDTWPTILTDAGLWKGPRKSPTPHWLRHMAVAVLAAAGASASDIQHYIGHESIETTMGTYGGMIGGLSQNILTNAGAILAGHGERGMVVSGEVVANVVAEIEQPEV